MLRRSGCLVDERGGDVALLEGRGAEHVEQEGDVRLDAADARLCSARRIRRTASKASRARRVLHEQRVVVRRDAHARVADAVDAHADARRVPVDLTACPCRARSCAPAFSVVMRHWIATPRARDVLLDEAELSRETRPPRCGSAPGRGRCARGHLLRHRVLHLDARVHLDEVVFVAPSCRRGTRPCPRSCSPRSSMRTASSWSASRSLAIAGGRFHAGAISTTFWWRRCTEQSRSHRWTTPLPSPTIWTSRGPRGSSRRSAR